MPPRVIKKPHIRARDWLLRPRQSRRERKWHKQGLVTFTVPLGELSPELQRKIKGKVLAPYMAHQKTKEARTERILKWGYGGLSGFGSLATASLLLTGGPLGAAVLGWLAASSARIAISARRSEKRLREEARKYARQNRVISTDYRALYKHGTKISERYQGAITRTFERLSSRSPDGWLEKILKEGVEVPAIFGNETLRFEGVDFYAGEKGGEKEIAIHFWREPREVQEPGGIRPPPPESVQQRSERSPSAGRAATATNWAERLRGKSLRGYTREDILKAYKHLRGKGVRVWKMRTIADMLRLHQAATREEKARILEEVIGKSMWTEGLVAQGGGLAAPGITQAIIRNTIDSSEGLSAKKAKVGKRSRKYPPGVLRYTSVIPRPAVEDVRKAMDRALANPVPMTLGNLDLHGRESRATLLRAAKRLEGIEMERPKERRRRREREESERNADDSRGRPTAGRGPPQGRNVRQEVVREIEYYCEDVRTYIGTENPPPEEREEALRKSCEVVDRMLEERGITSEEAAYIKRTFQVLFLGKRRKRETAPSTRVKKREEVVGYHVSPVVEGADGKMLISVIPRTSHDVDMQIPITKEDMEKHAVPFVRNADFGKQESSVMPVDLEVDGKTVTVYPIVNYETGTVSGIEEGKGYPLTDPKLPEKLTPALCEKIEKTRENLIRKEAESRRR
jgi:hypothetical protein